MSEDSGHVKGEHDVKGEQVEDSAKGEVVKDGQRAGGEDPSTQKLPEAPTPAPSPSSAVPLEPHSHTENAPDDASGASQTRDPEVVAVRHGMFGIKGSGDTTGYGGLVRRIVKPGSSPRPYGGVFDEVVDELEDALDTLGTGFDAAVERVVVHRGELTIHVQRELLVPVMQTLRDLPSLRFDMCMGVSGVHWPEDTGRELHAVYPLLSITHNRRIRVEVSCPDADPHIPSVVSVYPTNDWHERETWDFFGIIFDGHPALTRIEMPDDWPGHPQRKDYPLGGIPVEYKGAQIPPPDQRRSYS